MISSEIRKDKVAIVSTLGYRACLAYKRSEWERAHLLDRQLSSWSSAFHRVDSDLFWFISYVKRMVGEFLVSEIPDFHAFAMFKACQAFQGLQLDESDEQPEEQPVHHLTPESAARNIEISEQWRSETHYTPQLVGGYVIVYAGQVAGWIAQLRDANHWEPGVIAVGVRGSQYKAVGGDPYNGAESWQLVSTTQCLNGAAA